MSAGTIAILGVFVADTAYRARRQPKIGETILGESFALGPGGKGSNQAVACGRLGAEARIITKLGRDDFAELALKTWAEAGVTPRVTQVEDSYTGAAYIFVDAANGDNAIIIAPGAAGTISTTDVDAAAETIKTADVFMTQLEQPIPAAARGLEIARAAGVTTILNPAPAAELDDDILHRCDWVTPNESEAEGLTGRPVGSIEDAQAAAELLMARGAGGVVITLGEAGALLRTPNQQELIPAFQVGPVTETTGAGDAFNGGFAVALARGMPAVDSVRFGCAVAGISVTRPGTAPAMPSLEEVATVLNKG
ncbi:MAG: ribokinase [Rhodobacteraceae bacterium]|nr:ribokinase [Paracoccaceae bacterium]